MNQLNDPVIIISFRGDKSACAANSMKDTQVMLMNNDARAPVSNDVEE